MLGDLRKILFKGRKVEIEDEKVDGFCFGGRMLIFIVIEVVGRNYIFFVVIFLYRKGIIFMGKDFNKLIGETIKIFMEYILRNIRWL